MTPQVDEDGSEAIDQHEFESMVVVLSQNITIRSALVSARAPRFF